MHGPRNSNWGVKGIQPRPAGLCLCECHQRIRVTDDLPQIPKAEVHDWCGPCAEHRFTPWTDTLETMVRWTL